MNRNRQAIIALCSTLCPREGLSPLSPGEYRELAQILFREGMEPEDLYAVDTREPQSLFALASFDPQRIRGLLERTEDLMTEIASYEERGIHVITRAEAAYPQPLRATPGSQCPPLFYYAGELSLAQKPTVGYVGARDIDLSDGAFTVSAVEKSLSRGYGVVSGGARGTDSIAEGTALSQGSFVVEYPADSLLRRLRDPAVCQWLSDEKLLLLYPIAPHLGFSTPLAMMRNRFIYAHSQGTVITRSDLGKGGTWAGANDALKRKLCPILCHDAPYPGNQALIQAGALPIDHTWDGHLPPKCTGSTAKDAFANT